MTADGGTGTLLDLNPDDLLSTTRSVRLRLDLTRPVEHSLIEECLDIAQQAPTGGNQQGWSFVVVTDAETRRALGTLYKQGWDAYLQDIAARAAAETPAMPSRSVLRVYRSAQYLADHMGEVPVLVVPCIAGRTEGAAAAEQASQWGSILPAVWSFMLAARARGLGTCWTTLHLRHEREAAELLGIPYDRVMQAALIPVAHTIGEEFRPGPRKPLDSMVHWDQW
ncbi:MAG: nitroreductase [Thermomicrobiales bacterium]|nr:nitroreductase [Thermomicrobiales bacterium]